MTVTRAFAIAAVATALTPIATVAVVSTGEPAALLVFPYVTVNNSAGTDTQIQVTNTDPAAVAVRCQYATASARPGLTSFVVHLAADQPVAWSARSGLDAVPVSGDKIPGLGAGPWTGVLRCLASNTDGTPSDRNILIGGATVMSGGAQAAAVDSLQYSATGFDALPGASNGDDQLMLGGSDAEYAACPASLVVQSFLDGAVLDLGAGGSVARQVTTTLAVATCAHTSANDAGASVDFALTNEFGQQFAAARTLGEQLVVRLSNIDTDDPSKSIFSVGALGSLTGTIRITPRSRSSGVLALAIQAQSDPGTGLRSYQDALSPQLDGELAGPDVVDLRLPTAPTCAGDCNANGTVSINELVIGVAIALGNQPVSACPAFDANNDQHVTISELVTAVNNALNGC